MDSRLEIVNRLITEEEKIVVAGEGGETALLKQLRTLREDILAKANIDYIEVQKEVLDLFRELMEKLTRLSYFAKDADKDVRNIEKAVVQLNKLKSTVSEDLLTAKEEEKVEGEEATAGTDCVVEAGAEEEETELVEDLTEEDELEKVVLNNNGKYFTSYSEWKAECEACGCNVDVDEDEETISVAIRDMIELGNFDEEEGTGFLFKTEADYDNAQKELETEEAE